MALWTQFKSFFVHQIYTCVCLKNKEQVFIVKTNVYFSHHQFCSSEFISWFHNQCLHLSLAHFRKTCTISFYNLSHKTCHSKTLHFDLFSLSNIMTFKFYTSLPTPSFCILLRVVVLLYESICSAYSWLVWGKHVTQEGSMSFWIFFF